jgi:hypothetical protein
MHAFKTRIAQNPGGIGQHSLVEKNLYRRQIGRVHAALVSKTAARCAVSLSQAITCRDFPAA